MKVSMRVIVNPSEEGYDCKFEYEHECKYDFVRDFDLQNLTSLENCLFLVELYSIRTFCFYCLLTNCFIEQI